MNKLFGPQNGAFAEKAGSYGVAVRLDKQLVDPGERLRVELYISGYGNILASKLVSYPSPEAFDTDDSWVRCGMRRIDDKVVFGRDKLRLDPAGLTMDLGSGGVLKEGWSHRSMYFDSVFHGPESTPQIITEMCIKPEGEEDSDAPVTLDLKLRSKIRPGTHSLQFIMTYFNGDSWATSTEVAHFTVRGFYQRRELTIWAFGFVISILGLALAFLSFVYK